MMTREEAIARIKDHIERHRIGEYPHIKLAEALDMALSALRPVSREQVEKVWRGCEKCNGAGEYSRYAENLAKILLAKYCPHCGRPLTDEAVDMMLKRMEEIYK